MIISTPTRKLRVRAMYPGECYRRPGDAIGLYYTSPPHEIVVSADLPPAEQATVLIHEIVHSIYHERKMPTRAAEETVCIGLAAGLAEIIRDNPEIVAAIGLALTEGVPILGTP
jgi:hypothetical protein